MKKEDKINNKLIIICGEINSGNTIGCWKSCVECDKKVWLSNSSLKEIKEHDSFMIYCIEHGILKIKKTKENKENISIKPPNEDQIKEIISNQIKSN